MMDVLTTLKKMIDLPFKGQITAVMSAVYLVNGHLCGEIHGDKQKRFEDGKRIMTSPINFGFQALGEQLFLTHSGNLYIIAGWQRFDEAWAALDFSEGIQPVDLVLSTEVNRQSDFGGDIEIASSPEAELIRIGLPTQRHRRAIERCEMEPNPDQARNERNSQIFQLAIQMDRAQLQSALDSARNRFMAQEDTQVLIEYTPRVPDPSLLPLIALGYLPEWQAVLVLDGQFNVSMKAANHLATALVTALPAGMLTDELRDLKFQIDVGV